MSGFRPRLLEHEKVITPTEKDALVAYLSTPRMEWTRPAIIMGLIMKTGLRASEVVNLKVEHLILSNERPMICVWGGKKRKADQVDVVKISAEVAAWLQRWLDRTAPKEYVFEVNRHKMCRNTVWNDCKQVYKALGFSSKYAVHALRHRFITDTWKAFKDVMVTRDQARHKGVSMLDRYVHTATEESEDFRDKLALV